MKKQMLSLGTAFALALAGRSGQATTDSSPAAQQLRPMVESHLTGSLRLTVIEKDGDGYRIRAELAAPRYTQDPASSEDVAAALQQPFYFTQLPDGHMQSFYFAKGLSHDDRVLLEQLVTSMQSVRPDTSNASWKTTERDGAGEFDVAYTANGNSFTRTKTKMLQTNGLGGLMPMSPGFDVAVQSKSNYELAPSGWAQRVSSDESYDVHLRDAVIEVTTKTVATLGTAEVRPELVGAMPAAAVEAEQVSNARNAVDYKRASDLQLIAGRTFETLLEQLQDEHKQVHSDARTALSALYRVQPSELLKAEAAAYSELRDAKSMARLMSSIAEADTPDSQKVLISLLQGRDADRRADAAAMLGAVKHPTTESVRALLTALEDREPMVSSTALLACGAMARKLELAAEHDVKGSDDAERLVKAIVGELDHARDDGDRKVAILALGNAGHPQTLALLQPYLNGSDTRLRAAAVLALRFIPGAEADQAIIAALGDEDVSIREAAARTIGTRPVTAVLPAITQLLSAEKNKAVAYTVVNQLNLKRSETPAVDALLTSVAGNKDSAVSGIAQQVLKKS